jgi:hypothetical protein
VCGKDDLTHSVLAICTPRGFASSLNSGQKQSDKNTNNGDDDQKLDQSEGASSRLAGFRQKPGQAKKRE